MLTEPPVRIAHQGEHPIPGVPNATYWIGHDAIHEGTAALSGTRLSIDLEGRGVDAPDKYSVTSVQVSDGTTAVVFDPRDPYQYTTLKEIITEATDLYVHNSTFDVHILHQVGLITLDDVQKFTDTLIWARLAQPDERTSKSLRACAATYLGTSMDDPLKDILKTRKQTQREWFATADLNVPVYRIMAATDAILTHRLVDPVYRAAVDTLTKNHPFSKWGLSLSEAQEITYREQVINRCLLRRQCRGFLVDPGYIDNYRLANELEIERIEELLSGHGISPGDSASMARHLDTAGLLPDGYPRTPKTNRPSGAATELERLDHPIVTDFLKHKGHMKVLNDYLTKLHRSMDANDRIHPGTNVLAATTGRMSISGDAPLQQYPPGARGVILADPGERLTSIDWSQIEPVIAANIAGDTRAIEYYEAGNKFYDAISEFSGIDYHTAKTTLLAQLYGEGIRKLSHDLNVSMDRAKEIVQKIWQVIPGTAALCGRNGKLQTISENHKKVFTLSGRIIPIPTITSNGESILMAYRGVNYFVQGSAYDVLAESIYEAEKAGLGDAIYLAFHDELVVESTAALDIQRIMSSPPQRLCELSGRTPVLRTSVSELGERWGK